MRELNCEEEKGMKSRKYGWWMDGWKDRRKEKNGERMERWGNMEQREGGKKEVDDGKKK